MEIPENCGHEVFGGAVGEAKADDLSPDGVDPAQVGDGDQGSAVGGGGQRRLLAVGGAAERPFASQAGLLDRREEVPVADVLHDHADDQRAKPAAAVTDGPVGLHSRGREFELPTHEGAGLSPPSVQFIEVSERDGHLRQRPGRRQPAREDRHRERIGVDKVDSNQGREGVDAR